MRIILVLALLALTLTPADAYRRHMGFGSVHVHPYIRRGRLVSGYNRSLPYTGTNRQHRRFW